MLRLSVCGWLAQKLFSHLPLPTKCGSINQLKNIFDPEAKFYPFVETGYYSIKTMMPTVFLGHLSELSLQLIAGVAELPGF